MSLTEFVIPSTAQLLRALDAWLDKGIGFEEAAGRDADSMMTWRLAPDMYPLGGQVLFCCFMSQEAVYRFRGQPVPEAIEQLRRSGWSSGEQPVRLHEARLHIADALQFLEAIEPGSLDGAATIPIELVLPNGMTFDMNGSQYARDWVLPQFYFHLMIAYAILRNRGVDLGKKDFVPYLWAYIRPETIPQG
jgi:hypothetical protein